MSRLRVTKRPGSPFFWVEGTVAKQRIRESTRTDDRGDAEEYASIREAEIYRAAIYGAPKPQVTFAAAVISYMEAGDHSPSTKARINRLLRHIGQKATCEDIGQERLDLACRVLLRPGSKPATRQREVFTPVKAILTHAARRNWCPMPAMERARVSPARTSWITPEEADRLISVAADHIKPMLTFLLATGARIGEALVLDWNEVDLEHRRAKLLKTKNGEDRIVVLCPRAIAALANLQHRRGVVFRTRSGDAYQAKKVQGGGQIKKAWATAIAAATLRGITPHTLRHSWATWHYAMHKDLLRLREEGGWKTASQVERYTKLAPDGMAQQMAAWRGDFGIKLTHARYRNSDSGTKSVA